MSATAFPALASHNESSVQQAAGTTMTLKAMGSVAAALSAWIVAVLLAVTGAGAEPAGPYARMAPVSAYLMDRAEEIALARSAAPDAISNNATILVLTRTGYETAVVGKNGFVCLVERGFSGAPDWPERWNPKIRAAGCLNPQAARSIAPIDRLRTTLTLAGRSDAEILDRIKLALATKEIPPLEPGAMCYMMSKASYRTENGAHVMAHVMFYLPFKDGADWGANVSGSPIMGGNYWFFMQGHENDAVALPPVSVLLLGTATWSDGTPVKMREM
jgi:hypothetical protein